MLREIELQLDLLAAGHTPLKTVGPVQYPADHGHFMRLQRMLEFAVDNKMRKIGAEPHFRDGIQQGQGRKQIIGDAVAVGFELDRNPHLIRHVHPAPDHRDHPVNGDRHHLPDHINKGGAEIL